MSDDSDERRVSVILDAEERKAIRIGMAITDTASMAAFLKQAGLDRAAQLQAAEARKAGATNAAPPATSEEG